MLSSADVADDDSKHGAAADSGKQDSLYDQVGNSGSVHQGKNASGSQKEGANAHLRCICCTRGL